MTKFEIQDGVPMRKLNRAERRAFFKRLKLPFTPGREIKIPVTIEWIRGFHGSKYHI